MRKLVCIECGEINSYKKVISKFLDGKLRFVPSPSSQNILCCSTCKSQNLKLLTGKVDLSSIQFGKYTAMSKEQRLAHLKERAHKHNLSQKDMYIQKHNVNPFANENK